MYFTQSLSVIFTALAAGATYCAARRVAGTAGGVVAAVALACVPWAAMLGSVAYVESALLLYTALSAAWAINAARRLNAPWLVVRWMSLAGVCAGLACGVKYVAVVMVAVVIPLAMCAAVRKRVHWRHLAAGVVVFGVGALLLFAPWLVRNAMWAANPVFPLATDLFGSAHLTAEQVARFEAAHAPRAEQASIVGRFAALWSQGLWSWQYGYVVPPMALLGMLLALRSPVGRFVAAMLVGMTLVWLVGTHLIGRFLYTALVPGLVLVGGVVAMRAGKVVALAAVLIGCAVSMSMLHPRVDALAEVASSGFYGMDGEAELRFLVPDDLRALQQQNAVFYLIGDAQAFNHVIPSDRLRYRTVFDVRPEPGDDAVTAWKRGFAPPQGQAYEVINVPELLRLSRTYRHIPPPPADLGPAAIIVRPYTPPPAPASPKPTSPGHTARERMGPEQTSPRQTSHGQTSHGQTSHDLSAPALSSADPSRSAL